MEGKKDQEKVEQRERSAGASMVCVNCGDLMQSVYIEYSPGNIRLSTCAGCHSVVDKYVEYESMIIIIDVILHKSEAYRHVFFNYPQLHRLQWQSFLWRVIACCLFLDACRCASPGVGNKETIQWDSLTSFLLSAGKVVAQVGFCNCVYVVAILIFFHVLPKTQISYVTAKSKDILLAILLSSHFKFFVFAMMVWEFSPLMGLMVDMLVLSSNIVALKVMMNTTTTHATAGVISGAISKTAVSALLGVL